MDRAHGRIFEKAHSKPSNVLALGYRMVCRPFFASTIAVLSQPPQGSHRDEVGKPQPGRQGISNYAPNSMVEALKSHDWTTLLQRYVSRILGCCLSNVVQVSERDQCFTC